MPTNTVSEVNDMRVSFFKPFVFAKINGKVIIQSDTEFSFMHFCEKCQQQCEVSPDDENELYCRKCDNLVDLESSKKSSVQCRFVLTFKTIFHDELRKT